MEKNQLILISILIVTSVVTTFLFLQLIPKLQPHEFAEQMEVKDVEVSNVDTVYTRDDVVLRQVNNKNEWGSLPYDFVREKESGASLAVVITTDPDCDICTRNNNTVVPKLRDRFKDQSVTFGYRLWPQDAPITEVVFEDAYEKSQLAYCVGKFQGSESFYSYVDFLFENVSISVPESEDEAVKFGLTEMQIEACYNDKELQDQFVAITNESISRNQAIVPHAVIYDRNTNKAYSLLHDEISISQAINRLLRANQ